MHSVRDHSLSVKKIKFFEVEFWVIARSWILGDGLSHAFHAPTFAPLSSP